MDKFVNQILCCDCVEGMKKLPDGCIDLGLGSPPFDDLRRYGGQPFTDEVFRAGARELYRVIKPGSILCWDVQDRTRHGNRTGTSFRQALYFQEIGFRLARHHHHRVQRRPPALQGPLRQRRQVLLRFRQGKTEVHQHSA